jgi:hypothetical protein
MSEALEGMEQNIQATSVKPDADLDEIFTDKEPEPEPAELVDKKPAETTKKSAPKKPEAKETEAIADRDAVKPKEAKGTIQEDDDELETDKSKKELEKANKALSDSQKWAHASNRKLKTALRLVEDLAKDGVMTDEEYARIAGALKSDSPEEDERVLTAHHSPKQKVLAAANKGIEGLREVYEDDELFDKKISSFDYFVNHSSQEVVNDTFEELSELESTPIKLAKKMYSIGQKFYDDFYRHIDEAGGLVEYHKEKERTIEKMQKDIDKLRKKLSEYNDYDKPTHSLDELSENGSKSEPKDVMDEIFRS